MEEQSSAVRLRASIVFLKEISEFEIQHRYPVRIQFMIYGVSIHDLLSIVCFHFSDSSPVIRVARPHISISAKINMCGQALSGFG